MSSIVTAGLAHVWGAMSIGFTKKGQPFAAGTFWFRIARVTGEVCAIVKMHMARPKDTSAAPEKPTAKAKRSSR